jgi:hypothetical protein
MINRGFFAPDDVLLFSGLQKPYHNIPLISPLYPKTPKNLGYTPYLGFKPLFTSLVHIAYKYFRTKNSKHKETTSIIYISSHHTIYPIRGESIKGLIPSKPWLHPFQGSVGGFTGLVNIAHPF